ncbi:hypothetical protein J4G33_15415 [Actinotalea sp. BY-33]|uniref:Uncharacterized protein n=1 Tax=Actinotalea soli TaxID=2819234 RepID=A0A939LUZ7_9CELL|nr:hypothetical protein [Actinotalea soli]MBO1753195.1 hypothetical protein [Actinotalea soli]
MTHHPPAAPRAEEASPNRRRVLVLAIVISTVLHLVLAGGAVLALSVSDALPAPPAAQQRPATATATATATSGELDLAPLYVTLNEALAAQDREAFMSHVTGTAVEPLTLWWDNMDALGWTTAVISPADDVEDVRADADGGEIVVVLGADMGYAQTMVGEERPVAGGPLLTFGSIYVAEVDVTPAGPVISGWVPGREARPWDEGPLVVAAGDGIVAAGLPGEEDLVAEIARVGAPVSAWARDDYAVRHGHEAPLDGFVVFATSDDESFVQWLNGAADETFTWASRGFTLAGYLPGRGAPELAPEFATSALPTGAHVVLGPFATADDVLDLVLVHEFTHVLQFIDTPPRTASPSRLTIDGWARAQEIAYLSGGAEVGELTSSPWAAYLAECAGGVAPTIPTDDALFDDDAGCLHSIAATIFHFAEISGIDPVELAAVSLDDGVTPFGAAQRLGTPLSGEAWSAWFAETYL